MSQTSTITEEAIQVRTPNLWNVVIMNDDFTPIDFVIDVLISIFRKSPEEATELTMRVHEEGKAIVGTYTKDIATTRVSRAIRLAENESHPLQLVAEAS